MSASKLGLQFQYFQNWAETIVNSEYIKIIDPPNNDPFVNKVKTIGRIYIPDNETNDMAWRGAAGANEWFNRVAPTILARPWVFAWETINEPQPVADYTFCTRLAEFTKEAARLLRGIGRKSIGGNLSEGNPGAVNDKERSALFCAIAVGLAECDYWAQHCYWVPDGYNHPQAGYTQWHARYDKMNLEYAKAQGIKLPPRFITEVGIDGGIVNRPKQGWKEFVPNWDTYLKDHLARFDDDIADESDVLAAFIFASGVNQDWRSFEVDKEQAESLGRYIDAKRIAEPTPEPMPVIEPIIGLYINLSRPLANNIGYVTQWFGENPNSYKKFNLAGHNGVDYGAPLNSKVLSMHDGIVRIMPYDANGYGNYIKIETNKYTTLYAHLNSMKTELNGKFIKQGTVIGAVGSTGNSTGFHLHAALRINGMRNPAYSNYIDFVPFRT